MKSKNKFKFWNEQDDLYPTLLAELGRAYNMGYSVVEISRILNHANCIKLYEIMRVAGIIPVMGQGRRPKFDVPDALSTALAKCKLGFSQWCNTHDLDPRPVADALSKPEDLSVDDSRFAHWAFKNDFPTLYAKVYNTPPPNTPFRDPDAVAERNSTYSTVTVLDEERNVYVAYIPEMPDFRVEAKTRDAASYALKQHYILRISINKLKLLLPKS